MMAADFQKIAISSKIIESQFILRNRNSKDFMGLNVLLKYFHANVEKSPCAEDLEAPSFSI